MIWLAFPAIVILTVRFFIVLVNLLTMQWLKDGEIEDSPFVSILIPARNEEKNISQLLSGLLDQTYKNYEILIYDDDSQDGTLEIVKKFAEKDDRIKWIKGQVLPEGWSGKNHACHQLAMHAEGRYFLFIDADVIVKPGMIQKAIYHIKRENITLLSIFPKQLMYTLGEKLTIPLMNWILLSLLPLSLIKSSHYASLSAANGQFMLFRAREYRQHWFHEMHKDINVEDIHIMRKIKKMGYTGHTILSGGEIECRMYTSYFEGINGFTRSMFAFFGGSGIILILFTIFTTLGFLFVWLGISFYYSLIYLFIALLLRIIVALMSRQTVLLTALFSPVQQISFVIMVVQSFRLRSRGKNIWKGRTIEYKGI